MNSVVKTRNGATARALNTADKEAMKHYGYIYADGSYSDEREPRGAYLVPRRPSPAHFWDPDSREWFLDGDVMPPATNAPTESVGGDAPGKPPTVEQVVEANKTTPVETDKKPAGVTLSLPGGNA